MNTEIKERICFTGNIKGKKTMSIQEKIAEMEKQIERARYYADIVSILEDRMKWETMERVDDDSEDGYHYEAPQEDDYSYNRYMAYKEAIALLEKNAMK